MRKCRSCYRHVFFIKNAGLVTGIFYEENMRLPIFLDTDPGIDDAVAIAAAIFAPELDLQLMTTVAGNVSVEKTTRNALQLLHFWNA